MNCWIGHGVFSFVGSLVTGLATGMSITHWWVEVFTKSGRWYCAQKYLDCVALLGHHGQEDVTSCGKEAIGCSPNTFKELGEKMSGTPAIDDLSVQDVMDLISLIAKNGKYQLYNNNCQHFAVNLFNAITKGEVLLWDYTSGCTWVSKQARRVQVDRDVLSLIPGTLRKEEDVARIARALHGAHRECRSIETFSL